MGLLLKVANIKGTDYSEDVQKLKKKNYLRTFEIFNTSEKYWDPSCKGPK